MNQWTHSVVALILVSLAAGLLWTLRASADPPAERRGEVLTATAFELIGPDGKRTAMLWNGADGRSPQLTFFGADGQPKRVVRGNDAQSALTRRAVAPVGRDRLGQPIYTDTLTDHDITEIAGGGKFMTLDDGSRWEVDDGEEDRVETWGPVRVAVRSVTRNGVTLYSLYNGDDHEEVGARFLGFR